MNKKINLCLFFLVTFFFCSQHIYSNPDDKIINELSLASQLWEQGNDAFQEYNHEESIVFLKKALTLFEEQEKWSECVLIRCKIAENLDKLQKFEEMKKTSEQTVEFACEHLKEDDKAVGVAYHLLGETYWVEAIFHDLHLAEKQDLLKKAIAYFEIAENVFRQGNHNENLIENHLNMGFVRVHLREDIGRGELYLHAAISLANENLPKGGLYYSILSRAYGNLMKIHNRFTGDFDKALEYAHLSLQHRLELPNELPKDKLWLAGKYSKLGESYRWKKNYEMGQYYFKKAEELLTGLPPNELMYRIYHKQSFPHLYHEFYYDFYDAKHEESIAYHEKARKVVESDEYSPKSKQEGAKMEIYGNLTMIYLAEMEIDKANYWMSKFEEQLKKISINASNRELLGVYLGWAAFYKRKGDFDAAIFNLEKCFDYNYSLYNQIPLFAHNLVGRIYFEKEDYLTALSHFQKSLVLLSDQKDLEDNIYKNPSITQIILKNRLLKTLHDKGRTLYRYGLVNNNNQKNLEGAFDTYILAIDVLDIMRQEFRNEKSKKRLGEDILTIYEEAIILSLKLYELTQDQKYKEQAFIFSEKSKANLLMEAINDRQVKSAYLPDSLIKKEKEFQSNLVFYEGLIYEERRKPLANDAKLRLWKEKAVQLKEGQELFRQGLKQDYSPYFELKYASESIKVKNIQDKLSANQSFIEFFWGEEKLYAFVVSPNEQKEISLQTYIIGDVKTLGEQISTFVKNHENPYSSFSEYVENSHGLYQKILHPIVSQLDENIAELMIIPDGMLGYVPIEALVTELPKNDSPDYSIHNLAYVIEEFQINYTYSASLLLQNEEMQEGFKRSSENEKVLMAYAPSFYGKSDEKRIRSCAEELVKLDCAESEVYSLGEEWEGEVFIGERATKQRFLNEANNSDILHLATHACMDDHNPNFNRIYFSNDEYLSALELYTLQLNTQLTVLSACNTGSGQLLKGEGVMSLARGFMAAGCPSLITTLWGVNDCSSKKLMTRFYKHLYNGEAKDEALRNAKLDFLKHDQTSSLDSHPFYWAAFIQLGNRQAMFKEKTIFQDIGIYGMSGLFILFGLIGWQLRSKKWSFL
ncbi:MAG: CHAT domain-containing protein [Chitinophagales bacterium]